MSEKMEIIQRLVRDGAIDLAEALILLEGETAITAPPPFVPQEPVPHYPLPPWPQQWPLIGDPVAPVTWKVSNSNEVS